MRIQAPTGDPRFDSLLAAITDAVLSEGKLPPPAWLNDDSRQREEPWDVEQIPELQAAARKATPAAIKRHGIYLDQAVLQSVRWG